MLTSESIRMGLNYSLQLIMSGVLNIVQLVGVTTSLWTMDRFGRRPLLLWGSFMMTLSHFIIAILVGKFSSNWPAHRAAGWVSVAFLLFYMLSFGATVRQPPKLDSPHPSRLASRKRYGTGES